MANIWTSRIFLVHTLSHLVTFLYDGEIHCENNYDSLKIQDNLCKIFGFAENLNLSDPNKTVLDNEYLLMNCDTDDTNMPDKMIEFIHDQSNTEKSPSVRTTSFHLDVHRWLHSTAIQSRGAFYLHLISVFH